MKQTATADMVSAGVDTAVQLLPAELFAERGVDPAAFVQSLYQAMIAEQWRAIGSAPRDGTDLLLGTFEPSGFVTGIGRWMSGDEEMNNGSWSTEGWWGRPPTHWMPMPMHPVVKATA